MQFRPLWLACAPLLMRWICVLVYPENLIFPILRDSVFEADSVANNDIFSFQCNCTL